MKNEETIIKKENNLKTFEDLQKTATILAQDIANFLSMEIEELNIYSHIFKNGMERSLLRVLAALYKKSESVVIFPDSIPGFTMMAFKKVIPEVTPKETKIKREPSQEVKEAQVLDTVITRFFNKNQQKVMLIENEDVLFALFPVADTKKNLKDMELYITF